MKVGLKVFKLLVHPSIAKDALRNLKEIIEYNVSDPELPATLKLAYDIHGLTWIVSTCFEWLTNIVMPEWTEQLLNGHALTLAECEFSPHKSA